MKTIKLWIKDYFDRNDMLSALQGSGYNVWIEQATEYIPMRTFIFFQVDDGEVIDDGC